MIQELESWGVKFQKTPIGRLRRQEGSSQGAAMSLPMPEGYDIKKILTRADSGRRRREGREPGDGHADSS